MLQEFKAKKVDEPTSEGVNLYESHKNNIWGEGYDKLFFTALASQACYFKMTAEELMKVINTI